MIALAAFLNTLMECATTEKNLDTVCPFTQENVTQLNRFQRLSRIVFAKECNKLEKKKVHFRALNLIFISVGTKTSDAAQYKVKRDFYNSDCDSDFNEEDENMDGDGSEHEWEDDDITVADDDATLELDMPTDMDTSEG